MGRGKGRKKRTRVASRRGPRGGRGTRLSYVIEESYHGEIVAGSTLALDVPTSLPGSRMWKPSHVVIKITSSPGPSCCQIVLYNVENNRMTSTGPQLVVPAKISSFTLRWPFEAPRDQNMKTGHLFAIDHLCIRKGGTMLLSYTAKCYIRYGEESEADSCPKVTSTYASTACTSPLGFEMSE